MHPKREKVGLWMIGACGGVGSTVALGVAALGRGLADQTGLVSALPVFGAVDLTDPGALVVGGHEIRAESLLEAVSGLHTRSKVYTPELIRACTPQLRMMQRDIRPGILFGAGPTIRAMADLDFVERHRSPAEAIERIVEDLTAFRRRRRLEHLVVVHVASSEPPARPASAHGNYHKLVRALARPGSQVLPTSSLYALAAIEAGCAFINFTPSLGLRVPAIQQRARELGVPYMGSDGKTGETLVKSALAPMFAMRNLSVLSWVGQNILGNRDGAVLDDPRTRLSKIQAKDKTVARIVAGSPVTRVSIDYVPSLDDWKVAWDFVHFEGFLSTKMSLQFTWTGSDSILAAPLIIDLVRLAALECRESRSGPMKHLAFFFKDPIDVQEYDLFAQWRRLVEHLTTTAARRSGTPAR